MPYIVIEDFRGGLDGRRMALSSPEGTLQSAQNVHVNRGGELEKRLAFLSEYSLPAGTFGLMSNGSEQYVFGSIADPGVPVGVTYQRLQHPDGNAMTNVIFAEPFNGKPFVIASFDDGRNWVFHDGAVVTDFTDGVVRASFVDINGIAEHLKTLLDAADDFSATRSGAVITITGDNNSDFEVTATAVNAEGGTDDQAAAVATVQEAVTDIDEVLSEGEFTVDGGSESAGVNTISAITVDGISIIGAAIDWVTSNEDTAEAIAEEINASVSSPNYQAEAVGTTVKIRGVDGSGTIPNGKAVEVTSTGDVIIGGGAFEIVGGTASDSVTEVGVDGSDILTAASIPWATSNSATAASVASDIRTGSGSHGYTAYADGAIVRISKLVTNSGAPNNLKLKPKVSVSTLSDMIDEISGGRIDTSVIDMTGGRNEVPGLPKIVTVTISGTFDLDDLFTINLQYTDADNVSQDLDFGAGRVASEQPVAAARIVNKMHVIFGSVLAFSAVNDPSKWNRDDTGAGLIDIANQATGTTDLKALGIYQDNLAVFSQNATVIEFVNVDPSLNSFLQVVQNLGTRSPKSIKSFGDADLFFLSDTGVRSLRPRDSSNVASVSDIGTPVDDIIIAKVKTLTDAQIEGAAAEIEPINGRYLISLGTSIYVFTFFQASKISAWSEYLPGFQVDWWSILGNRLYARAGDTIYLYGGSDNASYDSSPVVVDLPYVDARRIAHFKQWLGVDVTLEGEWEIYMTTNPNDTDGSSFVRIATVENNVYRHAQVSFTDKSEVIKFRLKNTSSGAAKISKVTIHYEVEDSG